MALKRSQTRHRIVTHVRCVVGMQSSSQGRPRLLEAYVKLCHRRPLVVLVLVAALGALAALGAQRVRIDPSLLALLPPDSDSALALRTLKRRVAHTASLYLLVHSSDPATNQALAGRLRDELATWPDVRWAQDRRDPSFFLQHRLLYLSPQTLEEFADAIEDLVRWERCAAIPACVNISEQPQLPGEPSLKQAFAANPDVNALLSLFGQTIDAALASGPPRVGGMPAGQLCAPDGRLCVVEAAMRGDPDNLDDASDVAARANALMQRLRPPNAPADLRMVISGAYRNGPMERQIVSRDLLRTTLVGSALILVLLMVQFRAKRVLILLALPLAVGITWSLGLIGVVAPRLNILSAFGLSVLAGLGVDFGIHLFVHYAKLRAQDATPEQAVSESLRELMGPMVAAAATTGCGFAALFISRFRGFSQMGAMAALGVLLFLAAYLVLFPPLVLLAARLRPEPSRLVRWHALPRLRLLGTSQQKLWAGLALAIALGLVGTRIGFEYDFRKLRPPEVSHGLPWGQAVHGTTRTPIFMLGPNSQRTAEVASRLRAQGPQELGPPDLPWVFTAQQFVPADQDARNAAILRLRESLARALPFMDDAQRAAYETTWRSLLEAQPFSVRDMPAWIQDWLVERDGSFGAQAVAYTTLSGSDAHDMQILAQRLDAWRAQFPDVTFAAPSAQVGEVVPWLAADTPIMLGLALSGLTLGTLLLGRSWLRTLLVLAPLVVGMAATLGFCVVFGVKVHLYNIIMFPLAFGLGVDGAIYLVWTAAKARGEDADLGTAAFAIFGSSATTIAAFGSLLLARNPGIASLGRLAFIALTCTLAANLLWLPLLLRSQRVRERLQRQP